MEAHRPCPDARNDSVVNRQLRVLVLHTAFLGDVILTIPLLQAVRDRYPDAVISFVAIPAAAAVLRNHPAINSTIEYDKKGSMRGIRGLAGIIRTIRRNKFDIALVPHRSLRSALIPFLAGIPTRIGFDSSAGSFLWTTTVPYTRDSHEIQRNLELVVPIGGDRGIRKPALYPSVEDVRKVDEFLSVHKGPGYGKQFVSIAPGSVWFTKRWPEQSFSRLVENLVSEGVPVVLVGGPDDADLCERIRISARHDLVTSAAGRLEPLQSAELIRRSRVLVANDSAPMHMAVAMKTPVVAIFGATVPQFGFAPIGEHDTVLETGGLSCRPCSSHGGHRCPIRSFDCMERILPAQVKAAVYEHLEVNNSH